MLALFVYKIHPAEQLFPVLTRFFILKKYWDPGIYFMLCIVIPLLRCTPLINRGRPQLLLYTIDRPGSTTTDQICTEKINRKICNRDVVMLLSINIIIPSKLLEFQHLYRPTTWDLTQSVDRLNTWSIFVNLIFNNKPLRSAPWFKVHNMKYRITMNAMRGKWLRIINAKFQGI